MSIGWEHSVNVHYFYITIHRHIIHIIQLNHSLFSIQYFFIIKTLCCVCCFFGRKIHSNIEISIWYCFLTKYNKCLPIQNMVALCPVIWTGMWPRLWPVIRPVTLPAIWLTRCNTCWRLPGRLFQIYNYI